MIVHVHVLKCANLLSRDYKKVLQVHSLVIGFSVGGLIFKKISNHLWPLRHFPMWELLKFYGLFCTGGECRLIGLELPLPRPKDATFQERDSKI